MFTKLKSKVSMELAGPWRQLERKVYPDAGNSVSFELVDCEEILNQQLDRKAISLQTMLDNGVVLDPVKVGRMLNFTDSYDIERLNNEKSVSIYKYIKENQDTIIKSLDDSRKKQVESIK